MSLRWGDGLPIVVESFTVMVKNSVNEKWPSEGATPWLLFTASVTIDAKAFKVIAFSLQYLTGL